MMRKAEEFEIISSGKKPLAMIFRKDLTVNNVKFFTKEENPFQIGFHHRKKGIILPPHTHRIQRPLTIPSVQEFLIIQKGRIRVTFYTKNGDLINQVLLNQGDSILIMGGLHGVEILKEAKIIEIKQGPYPGYKKAKIYLKNTPS